jgi:hypothetical protein
MPTAVAATRVEPRRAATTQTDAAADADKPIVGDAAPGPAMPIADPARAAATAPAATQALRGISER